MTRSWRTLGLAVAAVVSLTFPGWSKADDSKAEGGDLWLEMLDFCISAMMTGSPDSLEGWKASDQLRETCVHGDGRRDCTLTERIWMRDGPGMMTVLEPLDRPETGVVTACASLPTRSVPGNDAQSVSLRALAHSVLDAMLEFRPEDQRLAPDVWRGCAWDGREFRLSSMTQTTWAGFTVTIGPQDDWCSRGTS